MRAIAVLALGLTVFAAAGSAAQAQTLRTMITSDIRGLMPGRSPAALVRGGGASVTSHRSLPTLICISAWGPARLTPLVTVPVSSVTFSSCPAQP